MRRVRLSTLPWRTRGRAAGACSSSPVIRASGSRALAAELTDRARGTGAQVGWGRCWEAGGAPAVLAVGRGAHDAGRSTSALTSSAHGSAGPTDDLGQIVPVLAAAAPDARLAPRHRPVPSLRRGRCGCAGCRRSTRRWSQCSTTSTSRTRRRSCSFSSSPAISTTMGLLVVATYRDADVDRRWVR